MAFIFFNAKAAPSSRARFAFSKGVRSAIQLVENLKFLIELLLLSLPNMCSSHGLLNRSTITFRKTLTPYSYQ